MAKVTYPDEFREMGENPFDQLLSEFRAAWAAMPHGESMFNVEFVEGSTSTLKEYFDTERTEAVCSVCLPVGDEERVVYHRCIVSLPKEPEHLKEASATFSHLAAAAGAALPPHFREALSDYCQLCWGVSHAAAWWFALLYALFEAPHARKYRPRIALHRPFLLSVDAIEECRLNTDSPTLPVTVEREQLDGVSTGRSNDDTDAQTKLELERLESETPSFDPDCDNWVKNVEVARIEGLTVRTLATYRSEGISSHDGRFGRDRDGRVWRRPGTRTSHPRYLRSTLKAQE